MKNRTLRFTLSGCVAIVAAGVWLANAGPLDPPQGPIQPTMRTLDEIYDLIASSQDCPPCTWEYKHIQLGVGGETQIVAGQGVLHGVWIACDGGVSALDVYDSASGLQSQICHIVSGVSTSGTDFALTFKDEFYLYDVAFNDGLYVWAGGNGARATVLYRMDN